MDTKELFEISANGYDCEQVEQYVALLKAQYKKLFDYAKATEGNNEKLKKICRALSDENKALKASGVNSAPTKSGTERIVELTREIEKIAASLSSDN